MRLLRLERDGPDRPPEVLRGLGRLINALTDGLSAQASLEPEALDSGAPLRALEFLLERAVADLEEMVAGTASGFTLSSAAKVHSRAA